jgi:FkbM family methyltransferase
MNIVQIGSNRGYDELTELIKNIDIEKLILVEPMSKFNNSLLQCYSHVKNLSIENIAITDDPFQKKTCFFLHQDMDENIEQGSLLESHVNKVFNRPEYNIENSYENKLLKIEVNTITINKLFNKYDLINIDILFIDSEGFDDKIIKNIDFNKFNIKKIYYEDMHINNTDIINFFKNLNYEVKKHSNYNSVAMHNDYK